MPRNLRCDVAGQVYHALNRGNGRQTIFHKEEDYEAFERVMVLGLKKFEVELFSYQWMPNHWHMLLMPNVDGEMGRFLGWVTKTHTARYHAHYHTTGEGHVYQGRFKSFPVEDDSHFLVCGRYVERNALTANLVERAEAWRWGSLWNWCGGKSKIKLSSWPVKRAAKWVERVNQPLTEKEIVQFQKSLTRNSPFGSEDWVNRIAKKYKLESTLRARGRPKVAQTTK